MSAEASPLAGVRWVVLSDGARPTEDIYFLESAAPALCQQGALVERFDTRRYHLPTRWALRRLAGANLCRDPHRWLAGRLCGAFERSGDASARTARARG